jgi:hypothetical protein
MASQYRAVPTSRAIWLALWRARRRAWRGSSGRRAAGRARSRPVEALPALGVARVEPQSVKAGSCETASLRFARGCERPRGSPTHYCSGRPPSVSRGAREAPPLPWRSERVARPNKDECSSPAAGTSGNERVTHVRDRVWPLDGACTVSASNDPPILARFLSSPFGQLCPRAPVAWVNPDGSF